MRLSDYAIKHPVTVTMAVLLVLLLGLVSLGRLPVDLLPELNFPVAVVITTYEGAGPREVENLVTRPLEGALETVSRVQTISSTSSSGTSMVMAQFDWGTDMNFATLQMREKIDLYRRLLPEGAASPLVLRFDPSLMPILQIGMGGETDVVTLKSLAEDVVKGRLERLEGVASVEIAGGLDRVIEVNLIPERLAGYGLAPSQVVQALTLQNLNLPGGVIEEGKTELLVRTTGEFLDTAEIAGVPVISAQGVVVRLRDVAEVSDTVREPRQLAAMNGKPSLSISVQKQTNANTVQVARLVKKELESLQGVLPGGVTFNIFLDQSDFVERALDAMTGSAIGGALLAIIVLYVFLRNLRSTLIIALSIPISVVATFILVYFSGLTLNLMSLGGIALGIGMLVDSAIVVLENIYRYRQEGYGPTEAASLGSAEVGMAVTASVFTTIAVFLPVVYVEGMTSQLFKQLALTVTFSLLASLVIALTLVPLLAALLLRRVYIRSAGRGAAVERTGEAPGAGARAGRLSRAYRWILAWSLAHRLVILLAAALVFAGSYFLFPRVGMEFLPNLDRGRIGIDIQLPSGTVLAETERIAAAVEAKVNQIPEVITVFTKIGSGSNSNFGRSGGEIARVDVKLVAKEERNRTTAAVVEELRREVAVIPGAKITVKEVSLLMGDAFAGEPLVITLKGDDLDVLADYAGQIVQRARAVPGTREITNSLSEGRPEIQVRVRREVAATFGLTTYQIATALRTAVSGQVATRYRVGGDEVDVLVQLPPAARQDLSDLRQIPIMSPLGLPVPLGEVAELIPAQGPRAIEREGQARVVRISMNVFDRDLGSVTRDVQTSLADLNLPADYFLEYGGMNKEMEVAFGSLRFALILAVVLVYMVMAAQFESLVLPLVIMFAVPFAFTGVVGGLLITGRTLNVPAFIGIIMLAGIVVNNAIVMVDYISTLRKRGLDREDAVLRAGPTRLRPILMTTLTTVLGLLPISLGLGDGGELQAPLATVVIGGLLVSTLLTLVVIPVLYTVFDDVTQWFNRLGGGGSAPGPTGRSSPEPV